ncbi:Flp pilus assembly protein RcpC/CpaB [hydrothermal vent metagenome]|uniref:Flp pilus assembly protein RcpC/CpaB n=1 Tax=hydrothermal vent metagenome TaxID=652676 RepID=A0A3B0UQJ9_9ZZZZ
MKPARILLLIVAVVAGGLAAFLVSRSPAPEGQNLTAVVQVEEPKARVLVAAANIGMGQRLSAADVQWQNWPREALSDQYITYDAVPDALDQMVGTVARSGIFSGEPILAAKLVRTDQGYLSAVIDPGMRAVSVGVTPQSAAGGFIVPNDRVDIVQTQPNAAVDATRTILANIRVLAIGQRLGEIGATAGNPDLKDPQSQMFADQTIATLELTPAQSETIIGAAADGELSLVLRSVADFSPNGNDNLNLNNSRSIRLVRFGAATSVRTGGDEKLALNTPPKSLSANRAQVAPIFTNGNSQAPQSPQSALSNSGPEIALQ